MLTIKATPFIFLNGQLYKLGINEVLRIYVLEHKREKIINKAHKGGTKGHFQGETTI